MIAETPSLLPMGFLRTIRPIQVSLTGTFVKSTGKLMVTLMVVPIGRCLGIQYEQPARTNVTNFAFDRPRTLAPGCPADFRRQP